MEQKRAYIRQGSLDSRLRDWKSAGSDYFEPDRSAPIKPIPVFHERSGFRDSEVRPSWLLAKREDERKPIRNLSDAEDILFNKRSGVTRIPAARVRRHSVQYDRPQSRDIIGGGLQRPLSADKRQKPRHPDATPTSRAWNSFDNTLDQKTKDSQFGDRVTYGDRGTQRVHSDRVHEPSTIPVVHDYRVQDQSTTPRVQSRRAQEASTIPRVQDTLSVRDQGRQTGFGTPARKVPVICDNIPDTEKYIPIDLTPVQSDRISHIICHKGSGNPRSKSADNMGVLAVDQSCPLAAGENTNDARATYSRQLSSSNITLSSGASTPSDVTPTYVKRNIHVRRHSVSTPSALRVAPKPKLLGDFQDWTSHRGGDGGHEQVKQPEDDVKSPEVIANECGVLVPVRRYSVTYAPKTEAAQPPEMATDNRQLATPSEKTKNKKKPARRRCRPLSIVNESISPTNLDGEEFDSGVVTDESVNDSSTTTTTTTTATTAYNKGDSTNPATVNIEREDGNVNIVAGGNVNICLKTDKPLSVIGRSAGSENREFAVWTEGSELGGLFERSTMAGSQPPVGMWRQGNVIVDGISPSGQGVAYGPRVQPDLPFAAQPLPGVQPIPMIYHPYLNPELRGGFGYQGWAPQKRSLYSPLSVDTREQSFLPFPVPKPVFRYSQTAPQGLLKPAADRRTAINGRTTPQRGYTNADPNRPVGTPLGIQYQPDQVGVSSRENVTPSRQPIGDVGAADVVNRTDDDSPPPQVDVKEMIAGFESKTDPKASVPEFGAAFGELKSSSTSTSTSTSTSRRSSKDLERIQTSGEAKYRLKVEGDDNWRTAPSPTSPEPTTLHAYIAEMSITERKYDDTDADRNT